MCFTCFSRNYKRIFYMFFSVAVFFFSSLTSFCSSLSLFFSLSVYIDTFVLSLSFLEFFMDTDRK